MFHPHPSRAFGAAFARKPYQGQAPELAKYVFVGLDANYAEDAEGSPGCGPTCWTTWATASASRQPRRLLAGYPLAVKLPRRLWGDWV